MKNYATSAHTSIKMVILTAIVRSPVQCWGYFEKFFFFFCPQYTQWRTELSFQIARFLIKPSHKNSHDAWPARLENWSQKELLMLLPESLRKPSSHLAALRLIY